MRQTVLPGWTMEVAMLAVEQYEAALVFFTVKDDENRVAIAAEQLTDRLAERWSRLGADTADTMSYIYDAVLTKVQSDRRALARAKGIMERAREQAYAYRAAAAAAAVENGAGTVAAGEYVALDEYIREVEHATDSSAGPDPQPATSGQGGRTLFSPGDALSGEASEADGVHPVAGE